MRDVEKSIERFMELYNSADSSGLKKNAIGKHVYFYMEEEGRQFMPVTQLMQLVYFFQQNEKCLALFRARNLNRAELVYKRVEALDKNIHPSVNSGVSSLFDAMAAYRDYVYANYLPAFEKLGNAIGSAVDQGASIPMFLIASQEQWLNKIWVQVKMAGFDEDSLCDEFLKLVSFAYTGIIGDVDTRESFKKNTLADIENGVMHVANRLAKMIDEVKGNWKERFWVSFLNGFEHVIAKEDPLLQMPASQLISLLVKFYRDEGSGFVEAMTGQIDLIYAAPAQLKKKLIKSFLTVAEAEEVSLLCLSGYEPFARKIKDELHIDITILREKFLPELA
jgi:hypothetical protein